MSSRNRKKLWLFGLAILLIAAWNGPADAWIDTGPGPQGGYEDPNGGHGDTDPDDFPIVTPSEDPISVESGAGHSSNLSPRLRLAIFLSRFIGI